MKKIILISTFVLLLISLCACKRNKTEPIINHIDYKDIYNIYPSGAFKETVGLNTYNSFEGAYMKKEQGYNNWYYLEKVNNVKNELNLVDGFFESLFSEVGSFFKFF